MSANALRSANLFAYRIRTKSELIVSLSEVSTQIQREAYINGQFRASRGYN